MLTVFHDNVIERIQDVEPQLNFCRAANNEGLTGSADMKHAARIPNVIIERYLNDNNITMHEFMNNDDHIKRMLNDPSLGHFRIWKGRI